MKKHIHILGASGSGTTTLAAALSRELGYVHLDTDNYYWIPTDPPFTTKRPVEERIILIKKDMEKAKNWILSGSNCSWGDFLIDSYDLVIFLYVPQKTRLERLVQREAERYGLERISPGGDLHESNMEFCDWAEAYDNGGMDMRSLKMHNEWLKRIKCPVVRIEGDQSVDERIQIAMKEILN